MVELLLFHCQLLLFHCHLLVAIQLSIPFSYQSATFNFICLFIYLFINSYYCAIYSSWLFITIVTVNIIFFVIKICY